MLNVVKYAFERRSLECVSRIKRGNIYGWCSRKWIESRSIFGNIDVFAGIRIEAVGWMTCRAFVEPEENPAPHELRRVDLE